MVPFNVLIFSWVKEQHPLTHPSRISHSLPLIHLHSKDPPTRPWAMGRPCLLSSCFAPLLSTYQGHALFGQTLNLGESMDWPISLLTCLDYVSNFAGHTLWHSNIAMENGLFVDVIYICIHSIQYNSTSNKSHKKCWFVIANCQITRRGYMEVS